MKINVYVQVLDDDFKMVMVDTVEDLKTALQMVENLRAQGFRARATVEVNECTR